VRHGRRVSSAVATSVRDEAEEVEEEAQARDARVESPGINMWPRHRLWDSPLSVQCR